MQKMKPIFKWFLALVIALLLFKVIDSFRPTVTIHAPTGINYLKIEGGYGTMDRGEVSPDLADLLVHHPRYLTASETTIFKMSILPKDEYFLTMEWRLFDTKPASSEGWPADSFEVYRNKIDFCHLDIYINKNGKIERQEKGGVFCIK